MLGKDDSMICNGTKYYIEVPESLGITRKAEFTSETLRIITGINEVGLIAGLVELRTNFNEMKLTKVGAGIETQVARLQDINNRRDPVLWAATLFINTENEDRTKVPSDNERTRKIEDWNAEGVPYFFLRGCVTTFSDTLNTLYAAYTQGTQVKNSDERKENPKA